MKIKDCLQRCESIPLNNLQLKRSDQTDPQYPVHIAHSAAFTAIAIGSTVMSFDPSCPYERAAKAKQTRMMKPNWHRPIPLNPKPHHIRKRE